MLRSPGVWSPPGPHTLGFHLVPHGVHHPTLHVLCLPEAPSWLVLSPLLCLSCHHQSLPLPHSPPHHELLRPQVRSQELTNFITKEDEPLEDRLYPLGVCLAHTVLTNWKKPCIYCPNWNALECKSGNSDRPDFLGLQKSLQTLTAVTKLKDSCSLEENLWQTYTAY